MPTGALAYCKYGYEATFGTAPGTRPEQFGHGVKVTSWSLDNAVNPIWGLGNPEPATYADGPVALDFGIEFEMAASDSKWLKGIFGAVTDGGATPYTHAYAKAAEPPSLTVDLQFDLGTDAMYQLTGVVITSANITIEAGDTPAHCSLTCIAKTVTESAASYGTPPTAPVDNVWSFGHATFTFNNVVLGKVERCEFKIGHDAKMIYGLGSRVAAARVNGKLSYSARVVSLFEAHDDLFKYALGSSSALSPETDSVDLVGSTVSLVFSNGAAAGALRKLEVVFSSPKVTKLSLSGVSVEDAIMEDLEIQALSVTATVSNNVSAGS
jgi:hypothetical protein